MEGIVSVGLGAGFTSSSSSSSSDSSSEEVSSSLLDSDSSFFAAAGCGAGGCGCKKRLWKGFFSVGDELVEVGEEILRAGSAFFRIDAFGRDDSSTRAGVGTGDALDDSLDSLDSLLAERVGFFCWLGAGVPDLTEEDCRERLVRSESS